MRFATTATPLALRRLAGPGVLAVILAAGCGEAPLIQRTCRLSPLTWRRARRRWPVFLSRVVLGLSVALLAACIDTDATAPHVAPDRPAFATTGASYTAVHLGSLGGASAGSGVNVHGAVAGYSQVPGGERATLWAPGGAMTDLGTLGGARSRAHAINESGAVVGWSETGIGQRRAFLWTADGGMLDLGLGDGSEANGINDGGAITGVFLAAGGWRAFYRSPTGAVQELGTLGGPNSVGYGINENGTVVGFAHGVSGTGIRAFRWTPATGMQDLGGPHNMAMAVNNHEQVVGLRFDNADGSWKSWTWTPGVGAADIGLGTVLANSINDAGLVVGHNVSEPFLWSAAGGYTRPDGVVGVAEAVRANGDLAGYGPGPNGVTNAILWTLDAPPPPPPPPPSLTPQDQLRDLSARIDALIAQGILNGGQGRSLQAKLDAAIRQLDSGNRTAANNQLRAFRNEVEALVRSGRLPASEGEALIAAVDAVIDGTAPPPPPPPPFGFASVSGGFLHSCGVANDGSLWCWGDNAFGQLGTGTIGGSSSSPVAVATDRTFQTVVTGRFHSCALATDGSIWCWGAGGAGQLGTGSNSGSAVPMAVASSATFTALGTTIGFHTCAVDASGAAYCWGDNSDGQLGSATTQQCTRPAAEIDPGNPANPIPCATQPMPVQGGIAFAHVSAGGFKWAFHSCGVSTAGQGYCWGSNGTGQLGTGGPGTSAPAPVAGGLALLSISAGEEYSCGLTAGGSAYCWGINLHGELGTGSFDWEATPAAVHGGQSFAALSAGARHTCAVEAGGATYCWGRDTSGELGDGAPLADRWSPSAVVGIVGMTRVSAGIFHSCAAGGGQAYCWGANFAGQLGDGSEDAALEPVAVAEP